MNKKCYQVVMDLLDKEISKIILKIPMSVCSIIATYSYPNDQMFDLGHLSQSAEAKLLECSPSNIPALLRLAVEYDLEMKFNGDPVRDPMRSLIAFRYYSKAAMLNDPHAKAYLKIWRPTSSSLDLYEHWFKHHKTSALASYGLWRWLQFQCFKQALPHLQNALNYGLTIAASDMHMRLTIPDLLDLDTGSVDDDHSCYWSGEEKQRDFLQSHATLIQNASESDDYLAQHSLAAEALPLNHPTAFHYFMKASLLG